MIQYKSIGTGAPILIIHGLFGTMDNWRTFARLLQNNYRVITIDLRNHGKSFWSVKLDYNIMAEDVVELINTLDLPRVSVIGHSMGGKVALTLAQNHPEKVARLIVVDIGFKQYDPGHLDIFNAILSLNISSIQSRDEADLILKKTIINKAVRQFLLKSLARNKEGGFRWKTNFDSLFANYEKILEEVEVDNIHAETLFIRGTKSRYISDNDIAHIKKKIPQAEFMELDTGHWIHAEQPLELFDLLNAFLNKYDQ